MASAVLICASLVALTACGEEETTTTAGSAPSASTAASSAPSASSASPAAASGGTSDKKLCESAKDASDKLKRDAIAAAMAAPEEQEELAPEASKKIFTDLTTKLNELAASGSADSAVVAALKQLGAETAKAAAAANPTDAADNPGLEKTGKDLTAACDKAGVTVNF